MARTLSSISCQAKLTANLNNTIDGSNVSSSASLGQTVTPASQSTGTGANQHDRFWGDQSRSLASGATEDIDLYDLGTIDIGAGAGKDALGQSIALAELTGLLVRNLSTSAGNLKVGGKGTTAAWNSLFDSDDDAKIVLPPGGFFLVFVPADPAYAVADSSNHLLKIEASGGDCQYDLQLVGRSA